MPNIEIHYTAKAKKKIDFTELGRLCALGLQDAYCDINSAVKEKSVALVRFIEASEYDLNIPDLCFVIKCGKANMSENDQISLCSIFDSHIGRICSCIGLTRDIEIFNTPSHGYCKDANNIATSRF